MRVKYKVEDEATIERYKNTLQSCYPNVEESSPDSVRLGPRLEIVVAGPQEDLILLLRAVELVALGPVVARRVGEDLPAAGEGAARYRLVHRLGSLQLRPSILEDARFFYHYALSKSEWVIRESDNQPPLYCHSQYLAGTYLGNLH